VNEIKHDATVEDHHAQVLHDYIFSSGMWEKVAKEVCVQMGLDEIPTDENDPTYYDHYTYTQIKIARIISKLSLINLA
jgi:hypothetical protein